MPRPRKQHVQQPLFRQRGGARPGAGRPAKGPHAGAPHKVRPELAARYPVHVVVRVHEDFRNLRTRAIYDAVREATIAIARRELNAREQGAFRIVHVSIQRTHLHLLVEADGRHALSRGMQGFLISAAKHINRAVSGDGKRRRGVVFPDRFHQQILTTPRQVRHALAYVLNNWRKHGEHVRRGARGWSVDPFSTGVLFAGWRERIDEPLLWRWRETYRPLVVYLPKTWLLSVGWQRGGAPFSFAFVPGGTRIRAARARSE